ncbi:YCF48-related protein [Thalassotalea psychrophila]|uniref:YCF48-related protein n=1 Tax=Thalassotalea psychrophila TaxID=3065647 RepID=A0ABY9TQW6_9GAMM|nr:YCF48-related protein [Colwelliaceae bacterium SQ149]
MIRVFKLMLVYCIFPFSVLASNTPVPAEVLPLASKSLMLDIAKISDTSLIAVGDKGHILLSNDGIDWQQQSVPANSALNRVYFINEQQGWAVGHDSVILNTTDGGTSWAIQNYQPEKERPLFDIVFFDDKHGIAVGAYGVFYRTIDAGKTWTEEFHLELVNVDDQEYLLELKIEDEEFYLEEIASILPHFNRLLSSGNELYLAGEIGMLAKSSDQGKTWQLLDEIYMGSFFDIAQINEQQLLVVGLRGNIFSSTNGGAGWQHQSTNTTALLNDVVVTDLGHVYVLANAGVILSSANGTDFTLSTQPDGKALIGGVWFNNKLIVASEVGVKVLAVN